MLHDIRVIDFDYGSIERRINFIMLIIGYAYRSHI